MKLTPKQEMFCLTYLETGNASAAYRSAYNIAKMKSGTVNRKAKELLDNGKITARLDELRKPVIEKSLITFEAKRKKLWEIVEVCGATVFIGDEENDQLLKKIVEPRAAIAAIGELNKMDGDLAAIKQDITIEKVDRNEQLVLARKRVEAQKTCPTKH